MVSMRKNYLTSELIAAAEEGNQERCQQIYSQGADVNGTNRVELSGGQFECLNDVSCFFVDKYDVHFYLFFSELNKIKWIVT